jgi:hypothetical protein
MDHFLIAPAPSNSIGKAECNRLNAVHAVFDLVYARIMVADMEAYGTYSVSYYSF